MTATLSSDPTPQPGRPDQHAPAPQRRRAAPPDGLLVPPDGHSATPDGHSATPDGQLVPPDGRSAGAPLRRAPRAPGNWLLGSLPAYKRNPVLFFQNLQRTHGDIVGFRFGPYEAHLVTAPEGISQLIQVNDRNYTRGRFYEKFKIFFGQGLLTMDGDDWKSHRRVAQPAFLRTVIGDSTRHIIEATQSMLQDWDARAARSEPVGLVDEAMGLTLASLSRTLFGLDVSDQRDPIMRAVDFGVGAMFNQGSLSEMLPSWLPTARNRGIAQHKKTLDGMIARIRAEHSRETATVDLVDLFQKAGTPDAPWSEQAIKDELMTIFLAGQETTALALCWTLYAIATTPHVREELEAEVDGLDLPTLLADPSGLAKLRYTRMVVDESLRLHPPIWLYTRDAIADDEILGCHIPAGSSVLVSPFTTHRRPDLWPNPDTFDPTRFDPHLRSHRHRFAYFPFGGGPRQCIGMHMALLELQIMTALIASRFRLEPVDEAPVGVGVPVLSLRPITDVGVRLRPRQPSAARIPE